MPNALWSLVHLLGSMKDADGRITIEGLYDDVDEPAAPELEAADRLPVDVDAFVAARGFTLGRLDAPPLAERPFYHRTMFHPTLTVRRRGGARANRRRRTAADCSLARPRTPAARSTASPGATRERGARSVVVSGPAAAAAARPARPAD